MKLTFEEKIYIRSLKLKLDEKKIYSPEECDSKILYIFDNYDEFKNYFIKNGYTDVNAKMLDFCILKTTKNDRIMALKYLCDYAITQRLRLKHQGYPEFGTEEMTEKLNKEETEKTGGKIIKRKDFKLLTEDFKHHV